MLVCGSVPTGDRDTASPLPHLAPAAGHLRARPRQAAPLAAGQALTPAPRRGEHARHAKAQVRSQCREAPAGKACYVQLRLARPLAADLRLPWQRPCPPGRLTPARVRRGFRNIRQMLPGLASTPKPGKPGPGRPPGSKNRRPATRHDVGKTVKRDEPSKKTHRQTG